jgi:hypothetical protein
MAYQDNDITLTKDVADPAGGADKVLKIVGTNSNALPVFTFNLPAGKTFADVKSFTFDAYSANKDIGLKARVYYINPGKFVGSRLPSDDANLLINPNEIKANGKWESYEILKSDCTYAKDGASQINLVPVKAYSLQFAIGLRHGGGNFEWYIKNVSVKF